MIYENCFLNGVGTKRGFCLVTGLFIYFYLYSTFILFPELSCRSLLFALFPSLLKGLKTWCIGTPGCSCPSLRESAVWLGGCLSAGLQPPTSRSAYLQGSLQCSAPQSPLEPSCCCDGHSRTGVLYLAPGLLIIRFSSDCPCPCPNPPLKIFLFIFLFLARFLHSLQAFPSYCDS